MSMAQLVITAVTVEHRSKSEVAATYGLSRRWVQKLLLRYAAEGEAAFEPRSRRPRSSPNRTPDRLEDEIVEMRKFLLDEGLDAGAGTIAYHLAERHGSGPSPSTIWRVLSRRGFITPEPAKRPRSSYVRFQAEQPNERWQADVTHVLIGGDHEVEVFNQLDDHSRLLVGSDARTIFKAADVVACFDLATRRWGTPQSYLTDNAALFTGAFRGKGWVALERELVQRGVRQRHGRPYHPQTQGKVERFHQTLKQWLAKQEPAADVAALQRQLDVFRDYYNEFRPHRAIGRRPPLKVFNERPKALPADEPLPIGHFRTRRDVVGTTGKVTLRVGSRLHHIGIGRPFAGVRVLLLVHDLSVRVIVEETGELLRELVLDLSRDYQPLEV
jgi:transposase InsO family protein